MHSARFWTLGIAIVVVACGSTPRPSFLGADAGGGGGNDPSNPPTFGDASTKPGPGNGCSDAASLVYVTGDGDQLYSFYPPTKTFKLIGKFDCLTGPTHMTVDRQANAWVVSGGLLYKASTADATCVAVSTWQSDFNYSDFALTFIGTEDGLDTSLYILNDSGDLGLFNAAKGGITSIGAVEPRATLGDMTTNADGSLYFLQDIATPVLWNFSAQSGATISQNKLNATGGGSQALAFWGGSFYAFENSQIYQYDPKAKTTKPLGAAPLQVTGAGQSTCVPTVPPT